MRLAPGDEAGASGALSPLIRRIRGLGYGAFFEKRWRVATARLSGRGLVERLESLERRPWEVPPLGRQHRFLADPFFLTSTRDFVAEAFSKKNCRGELVRIRDGMVVAATDFPGHASYPMVIEAGGEFFILPEIASWSSPQLLKLDESGFKQVLDLRVDGVRLLDPTMLRWNGRFYLFANEAAEGTSVLHLWTAQSLEGEFRKHPASPVRTSVRGSRMAGPLLVEDGRLYRIGQDLSGSYGDGVVVFQIDVLTETEFREAEIASLRFQRVRGPHTIGIRGDQIIFDWYVDRFSPFAGVRRILSRLQGARRGV